MIEFLKGQVLHLGLNHLVLDVAGVGYGLTILPQYAQPLAVGEQTEVWVYTRVREDALQLFGFQSLAERSAFEILIQVNGVGPKVAERISSCVSVATAPGLAKDPPAPNFSALPCSSTSLFSAVRLPLPGTTSSIW